MQPALSDDTISQPVDEVQLAFPDSRSVWLPTEAAEGFARDLVAALSGATSTRRTGQGDDVLVTACRPSGSGVAFSIETGSTTVHSAVGRPGISLMVDALVGEQPSRLQGTGPAR